MAGSAVTNVKYKATGAYQLANSDGSVTLDKTVVIGTFTEDEVLDLENDSKFVKAVTAAKDAAEGTTNYKPGSWSYSVEAFDDITTTDTVETGWFDEELASNLNQETAPVVRFSKTANKVAAQFEVTGSGAESSNFGNETYYNFTAAGFGTFDAKSMAVKSISGSVVGTLPSLDLCDEYANCADLCDEFETWCDYADPGVLTIPAFGTWTA